MYRSKKLTQKDLEEIANMPYEEQVSLFKTRAMNRYKEEDMKVNPTKYKQSDKVFQKQYNTRLRDYNINRLEEFLKKETLRRSSRINK